MRDTNVVSIVGRLIKNSTVTLANNGTPIGNIVIAVNSSRKTGDKWEDVANFFEVTFFGSMAKNLQQYLIKGKQICVTGELRQDRWVDGDGKKCSNVYILASNVQLIGGNRSNNAATPEQTPAPMAEPTQQNYSDDVLIY